MFVGSKTGFAVRKALSRWDDCEMFSWYYLYSNYNSGHFLLKSPRSRHLSYSNMANSSRCLTNLYYPYFIVIVIYIFILIDKNVIHKESQRVSGRYRVVNSFLHSHEAPSSALPLELEPCILSWFVLVYLYYITSRLFTINFDNPIFLIKINWICSKKEKS